MLEGHYQLLFEEIYKKWINSYTIRDDEFIILKLTKIIIILLLFQIINKLLYIIVCIIKY